MPTVVFVCTGNICRSPMAEYLARSASDDDTLRFASAGTAAAEGSPPSSGALLAMGELGIDISDHRATDVRRLAADADLLFGLSSGHVSVMRRTWPGLADRIHLLHPDGRSIPDPYGQNLAAYRAARGEIAEAVREHAAAGWF